MKRSLLWTIMIFGTSSLVQAQEVKWSEFLNKATLSGDLRLRHEIFDKNNPVFQDKSSQCYRLRLALGLDLPHDVKARLRLASGGRNQISSNQNFDNLSSRSYFGIDQAYLAWTASNTVILAGGRMQNPFWRTYSSDIVWDEDFNPEGFAQSTRLSLFDQGHVFFNALQMVADEDSGMMNDQWMFGEQLGFETAGPSSPTRARVAVAFYDWQNEGATNFGQVSSTTSLVQAPVPTEGNRLNPTLGGSPLLNSFGVLELTGEFATLCGSWPLSFQGTYIKNLSVNDDPKEDTGYQAGVIVGQAKEKGTWELAYFYKHSETDSTIAAIADSDFGDGGTNRKGSIFWTAYSPWDAIQIKAKAFLTQVVNQDLIQDSRIDPDSPGPAGNDWIKRYQLDVSLKF